MKKQLQLTLFTLLFGVSANAAIVYVNSQATGSNNGTNWINAFTEIQQAIASSNSGDELWIASGIYYPTADISGNTSPSDPRTKVILIDKEITLYGGFSGSETLLSQRDWATNETLFSGDIGITGSEIDNCRFVFQITANAQIDGVSIKDAYQMNAGIGSALQVTNTDFTLKNSQISDNFSTNGSGLLIRQGTVPSSTVIVDNCHFYSNYAENKGAGIDLAAGSILVTNSIFDSNTAEFGSSVVLQDGFTINEKSRFVNCLFTNNHSYTYGGMSVFSYARPAGVEMVNCTMTNNTCDATDPALAGSIRSNNVDFRVRNTILWDNNPFQESGGNLTKFTVDNSIIYGGFTGNNNQSTDPLFSNVTNNDFTLQPTSGAIDAGDTTGFSIIIPLTDLNGNPRYQNGIIDLGAYEYENTSSASINEFSNSQIVVYPNPTSGLIYFENSIDQVNVYELNGKLIQTEENVNRIDLNHLSQGTYLIQMSNSSFTQTERVVLK